MNSNIEPIRKDEQGEWYSIKGMVAKTGYTAERIRQLGNMPNPSIIKSKDMGVILFRLAEGWEFSDLKKGLKKNLLIQMNFYKTIKEFSKSLASLIDLGLNDTKINLATEATIAVTIADSASKNGFRKGEDSLFLFNGTKYDKLSKDDVESFICGLLEELNIGAIYQTKSIETIFKRIYRSVEIESFAPSKSIISFRNCCLNIKTMQTNPHNPDMMTRTFFDFDYDPSAHCDLWEEFLVRMLRDPGSRLILQEFLGMMFIDPSEFKEAKACFLYGSI